MFKQLGYGFLEKTYQNAMILELKWCNFKVETEKSVKIFYKNYVIGNYAIDLLINDST